MLGGWANAGMTIAEAGKPIIFAGDVYGTSGEILVSYAAAKRRGLRVAVVSSTRFEDVCDALRSFVCLKRLRSSAILDIGADPGAGGKAIEEAFGTKVVPIPFPEINALWEKADAAKAREWADRWIRGAVRVVEPTREEIQKSAAMYLALRELLERHRAQAVTMNCLGGVYSGQTHAPRSCP
jgi:L-fucose isomerase-like protein